MNAEKDKAPERPKRVWITWDDAYPWPTPEMGGDEYVHIDLLATARKEAFREAIEEVSRVKTHTIMRTSTEEIRGAESFKTDVLIALERAATDTDKTEKG